MKVSPVGSLQQCMKKYEKLKKKILEVAELMGSLVDEVNDISIRSRSKSRSSSKSSSKTKQKSRSHSKPLGNTARALDDEQVNDLLDKFHMGMISAENLGQAEFSRIMPGITRIQKAVVKHLMHTGFSKEEISEMLKITPTQKGQLEQLLEDLVAKAMQPLLKAHMAIAELGESGGRIKAVKVAQKKLDEQLNVLGIMRPDMTPRDFDKMIQSLVLV